MTIKEVCDSLIAIEEILSIKTNPSEINGMMNKLAQLTDVMGLCSSCIAWSESFCRIDYAEKILHIEEYAANLAIFGEKIKNMGITERGKLVESWCDSNERIKTLSERLHKSIVHASENLRTLISYAKEESKSYNK